MSSTSLGLAGFVPQSRALTTTATRVTLSNGQKVLAAAITKLASLGLDKAEEVVLHGISHGGTAVILNADKVGALLAKAAPGLKTYKAVPVDGIREQNDPLDELLHS